RVDEVLLLARERAYRDDPCLCGAVFTGLGFLELYNPARFTINENVLANLQTANFDRLAHETASRRRAVLGLHLKDFARFEGYSYRILFNWYVPVLHDLSSNSQGRAHHSQAGP